MVGTLLKWIGGTCWTLGFVICPMQDAFAPRQAMFVPDRLEQKLSRDALPSHASATEPLAFARDASLSLNAITLHQRLEPRPEQVPLQMWTPTAKSVADLRIDPPRGEDGVRFQQIMQFAIARSLHHQPMGEIVQAIGQQLLGSAYQPNLLDQTAKETLVLSLTRFDCVLFVETVLALARGVALQDYSYQTFAYHVQQQRYRDGNLDGYCSRLHYFSEWMADNQRRGNVLDIVPDLGGGSLRKVLNFMSNHRHSYPLLVSNDKAYRCIQEMETTINPATIRYIPQGRIHQIYGRLQAGDVVAIATDLAGLDVTHTGLVYRNRDGSLGLIHATPGKGVAISPDLQRYVNAVENRIGILIARPTDPRQQPLVFETTPKETTPKPRLLTTDKTVDGLGLQAIPHR